MHRHPLAVFALAAVSLLAAFPLAIVNAVERGVAFVWAWLAPEAPKPAVDFDDHALAYGDVPGPLDPALLNSLRHEAGMRPLRC